MTPRRWIRRLFARTPRTVRSSTPARRPTARPSIEFLEDRIAPAQFTLTSLADDNSPGTLRYDIAQANANGQANTIFIPGSLVSFFGFGGTIALSGTELPAITGALSIVGDRVNGFGGPITPFILSGNNQSRVLEVAATGNLTLDNLIISGGKTAGDGGGILNQGTLTLKDVTVSANQAVHGGGIANAGTLALTSAAVTNNQATAAGGGLYTSAGTVTLNHVTVSNNKVQIPASQYASGGGSGVAAAGLNGDGGGLAVTGGSVQVTASSIFGNLAQGGSGADGGNGANQGPALPPPTTYGQSGQNGQAGGNGVAGGLGGVGRGGGISVLGGSLAIIGSTVANNTAQGGAGGNGGQGGTGQDGQDGAPGQPQTFGGGGGVGGSGGRGGDGGAGGAGGAGSFAFGGGLYVDIFATQVTVTNSTLAGNQAIGGQGGRGGAGGAAGNGGNGGIGGTGLTGLDGIGGRGGNGGAGGDTGRGGLAIGGGVFYDSSFSSRSMTSSTVAFNQVVGGPAAAPLVVNPFLTIPPNGTGGTPGEGGLDGLGTFRTAGGNTGANGILKPAGAGAGGGIGQLDDGIPGTFVLTLVNSIVAGNTTGTGTASDIDGTLSNVSSSGYNLIGTGGSGGLAGGQNGNQVGVSSPGLTTLGSHGGPTQTVALQAGSPAIDAGNSKLAVDAQGNPLTTDQRGPGFQRVVGAMVDIGAFELQQSLVVTTLQDEDNGTTDPGIGAGTSLREAIKLANSLAGPHTITFAPGLTGTITLSRGELDITGDMQIEGSGAQLLTISGNHASRVFNIDDGTAAVRTVSISGLTITGGTTSGDGGGIRSREDLTLNQVTVSSNSATGSAGGIENDGTLTLTDCTLTGNSADAGSGLYNTGTLTVTACTFANNTGNFGSGLYNVGTLTLTASTLASNSASNGGGIANNGTLTLTDCTLAGNSAINRGGGIYNGAGPLTVRDCTLAGNSGPRQGGGIYNENRTTPTLVNTLVAGSRGGDLSGTFAGSNDWIADGSGTGLTAPHSGNPMLDPGGLKDNGGPTKTIAILPGSPAVNVGVAVAGVTTDQRGIPRDAWPDLGAYEFTDFHPSLVVTTLADEDNHTSDPRFGSGTSLREAIEYANTLPGPNTITFDPSVFGTPQTITLTLGPLELTNGSQITIDGGSAGVTLDGNGASGIFQIDSGATVSLTHLTLTHGSATDGGAIDNAGTLTVTNSTLASNSAGSGGGIFNAGMLTVTACTFASNAAIQGGGIYNAGTLIVMDSTLAGSQVGSAGGGIDNTGTLTVTACTLASNTARLGGGINNEGTLTVADSTLASNSAGEFGGGIFNNGTLTVTDSTLASNSASAGSGGGILNASTTTPTLVNTLVACSTGGDLAGSFAGAGDWIADGSGSGLTSPLSGDPMLDPNGLRNNGGPTQTIALLPGSRAIGAGDGPPQLDGLGNPLTTDQRGYPFQRVVGGKVDIGAYEAQSLTLVVDNTGDSGTGKYIPGEVTLREAVQLANANPSPDTIVFDPTVFATPQTITLMNGPLVLSDSATTAIDGGTAGVTLDGNGASGIFQIDSGATASLTHLTLTHGSATDGGGIDNAGTLAVTNSTLASNSAGSGGGIYNTGTLTVTACTLAGNTATQEGGGIDNAGTLTVTNSTLADNSAILEGGGIYNGGTLTVTACTLVSNSAIAGSGGGIFNASTTSPTLDNTLVAGSTGRDLFGSFAGAGDWIADATGSGLTAPLGGDPMLDPAGLKDNGGPTQTIALLPGSPAIGAGSAALDVDAQGNPLTTDQRGAPFQRAVGGKVDIGAYEAQSLTLVVNTTGDSDIGNYLPGQLTLREAVQLANINPSPDTILFDPTVFATPQTITLTNGPLVLSDSAQTTIDGGPAGVTLDGNGASSIIQVNSGATASLDHLTLTQGFSLNGGGINNAGTLTVTACTLTGNSTDPDLGRGGGIYNAGTLTVTASTFTGNSAGAGGGGIFNDNTLTVTGSTFADNSTDSAGGGIDNQTTLTLINSTLSGNSAAFFGGGIFTIAPMTVTACTLAGNSASQSGGSGITTFANSPVTLDNTLVAGSTGGDLVGSFAGAGDWVADGSGSGLTAPLSGDPMLDPAGLKDNGGPTQTIALLPGSPALGAGSAALAVDTQGHPLTSDQRGYPFQRVVGGKVDIGAYEAQSLTLVVDNPGDSDTGNYLPGQLTLREAAHLANINPGPDTIAFAPALFAGGPGTITLDPTLGELSLTDSATTTIQGPGPNLLTISGGNATRVFDISGGADLAGLTVADGEAPFDDFGGMQLQENGGGVRVNNGTVQLSDVVVTGSNAFNGGGLYIDHGTVALTGVTFSGNLAGGRADGAGGGLADGFGALTMTNVTVANNNLTDGLAGGGLAFWQGATATLTNVTVAGNTATGAFGGGGVYVAPGANVYLNNVLVAGNSTDGSGGGVLVGRLVIGPPGHLVLNSSLVAGNAAGGAGADVSGPVDSSSTNYTIGYPAEVSALGQIVAVDGAGNPLLADNGGPTPTIALVPGSPAIDAGNNSLVPASVTTDQRGLTRITGAAVDLGAYEVQLLTITTAKLPDGAYGTFYDQAIAAAEAGFSAFTFSVSAGSLPPGLTLAGDGTLSGTPTTTGPFSFTVQAQDRYGFTASQAYTVTIAPPTASIVGPTVGVPGQPLTYTFAAGGLTQGITFTISYGDGTSLTTSPGGPSVTLDHLYAGTGNFTIQVTATDQNGVVSQLATQTVKISTVALEPDPSGGTALAVGGSAAGGDTITVTGANTAGTALKVKVNRSAFGPYSPTGHIFVYGQGGNDRITLSPYVVGTTNYYIKVPAFLYGEGPGGDKISAAGSAADNVLTGHGTNETLTGGHGRDLLIGGTGAATLHAVGQDDILIGGWTDYDLGSAGMTYAQKLAALEAIMAEWGSADPYATRLSALAGSLSATTVHDNYQSGAAVADLLAGNLLAGEWFFAGLNDKLTSKTKNDVVTRIQ
jgi:CSLREA domain-containing protein